MTDMTDRAAARVGSTWFPAAALVANLTAIGTVMFWIYYSRATFIALHPEYVAVEPPTISRAISDPLIGVPFHFWVSLSGLLLVFGVYWNALFYWRLHKDIAQAGQKLERVVRIAAPSIVAFQALSGVGMYLLSGYRFPDHHETHMVGSYTFFISQAIVVLIGTVVSTSMLSDKSALMRLHAAGFLHPGMVRLRKWSGVVCLALTVCYIGLFQAKNMDFGVLNAAVYVAYTSVEPALITCFLLFLGLFQTDLMALRRFQRRS